MEPEESKCLSSQLFGLLDGLVSHNPQIIRLSQMETDLLC